MSSSVEVLGEGSRSGLTHHLESIELIRHCLDLLFLVWLFDFDSGCIPILWVRLFSSHYDVKMIYHLMYLLDADPSAALLVPLSRLAASVVWSCKGRVILSSLLVSLERVVEDESQYSGFLALEH